MIETKKKITRQIATKISIQEILNGEFIQDQENKSTYLKNGAENVYRVNLICIILQKEQLGSITNFLIDDGSAKIVVRFFENNQRIEKISVGNVLILIGKIRIYNQEKYISPEIWKKVDPLWLKVRSIEKNQRKKIFSNKINKESINKEEVSTEVIINELINESKENIEEKVESLPFEKIINLVNELDSGSGVLIEEIIQKSSLNNTEEFIQKMLERGDIFQNQPGKIKVL